MSIYHDMGSTRGPLKISKRVMFAGLSLVGLIVVSLLSLMVIEVNEASQFQVKQSLTGSISVHTEPGPYFQSLGSIYTYNFSQDLKDSMKVKFPDGWVDISYQIQYELPGMSGASNSDKAALEKLHFKFERKDKNINRFIQEQVEEAIENTGSLFNSEEAYSDRRPEFAQLSRDQAVNGLYAADVKVVTIPGADNTERKEKRYHVKLDDDGNPVITKSSIIAEYNIKFTRWNIMFERFDPKLSSLIEKRKDAQLEQQKAITAKAAGEAKIAEEKANQEVEKIKEVTVAEKNKAVAVLKAEQTYEVEKLKALEAIERAKKVRAEGEATAAANAALVRAGLTPLERATIEKETAIGVADKLSKMKWPSMMIFGGGNGANSPMNPFDAVGLDVFMKLSKDMSKGNNK